MKRRTFIISTAAGIGVISATAYYLFNGIDYDPELADPESLSLIWDEETINDIGRKYRTQFPAEESERSLVKLLSPPPTEETITSDFKNGNTVIIDGWILSKTEARQCALSSLQSTQPEHAHRREASSK